MCWLALALALAYLHIIGHGSIGHWPATGAVTGGHCSQMRFLWPLLPISALPFLATFWVGYTALMLLFIDVLDSLSNFYLPSEIVSSAQIDSKTDF